MTCRVIPTERESGLDFYIRSNFPMCQFYGLTPTVLPAREAKEEKVRK